MKDRFLLSLLLVCLILGIFTFNDYGESWDEHSLRKYAEYSLRTYQTWRENGVMPITEEDLGNYGPAYMMTVTLITRALNFLPILPADIRHALYFLTHLAGIWAFYQLGQRWLSLRPARYATLLYTAQPIFWGHAFINPKDTPFLALFMLSLLFGLRMIDSWDATQHPKFDAPLGQRVFAAGGLILVLASFALTPIIHAAIETLVRAAAAGETNLITRLASDLNKVPPEVYIQKYFTYFLWTRATLFIFFLSFTIYQLPITNSYSLFSILYSSLLLGFSTATRIIAPFAGILVSLYAIHKHGKRAFPLLFIYALFSILFTYITWPYLWSNPLGHFIEALQTMSKYPWFGTVLFNGQTYDPTQLPYSYLPFLLFLQFTEPIWVLFVIGLMQLTVTLKATVNSKQLLALTLLWFLLPLAGFILTRAKLYDNFRQILFILPPVFLLAGLGMESLLARVTKPALRIFFAAVLILPGLWGIIRLHPYQYIYYNIFAGNPNQRFELDYWATSYREAMNYLNKNATPNANIMVVGPGQAAEIYAREDLTALSDDEPTDEFFAYAIVTTRYNYDERMYPQADVVYNVEREGLLLSVVKKFAP